MGLTSDDVEEILRYLDASPFDELHLETDGLTLHLHRSGGADRGVTPAAQPARTVPAASQPAAPQPAAPQPAAAPSGGTVEIRSAFLGTFYSGPKPGAAPFVTVGSRVAKDSVVCIIEVMKLMNSLEAGVAGEVLEICAEDGQLVEAGQVLFRLRAAAP